MAALNPFCLGVEDADFSDTIIHDDRARLIAATLYRHGFHPRHPPPLHSSSATVVSLGRKAAATLSLPDPLTGHERSPPEPFTSLSLPSEVWTRAVWYSLRLNNCWLSPLAVSTIATALQQNDRCYHLSLNGNEFVDESSICDLVDATLPLSSGGVVTRNQLMSLSLLGCGLRSAAMHAVTAHLTLNRTLTSLDISANYIGDTSGKALGSALTSNRTLTSLHINRCGLTSSAFAPIIEALRRNLTIRELYADGNLIGSYPQHTRCTVVWINH